MLLLVAINKLSLSHGIGGIKINSNRIIQKKISSSRNKNKRTETSNDDKRSHQHHKLLTIRNTKFINSKFTSQIKENQSWSQSKTQTLLLLQYPLPHQYPDLFESIDYNRSHKLSYMANTNENLFVQITSMGIQ